MCISMRFGQHVKRITETVWEEQGRYGSIKKKSVEKRSNELQRSSINNRMY